jgi:hypothetical protein
MAKETKSDLQKQYEAICTVYVRAFELKHGFEFSGWVGDFGCMTSWIEQYFFGFDDIRYDIDHKVKKGLIFEWQDATLEYNAGRNFPTNINFKSYAKGLRYDQA